MSFEPLSRFDDFWPCRIVVAGQLHSIYEMHTTNSIQLLSSSVLAQTASHAYFMRRLNTVEMLAMLNKILCAHKNLSATHAHDSQSGLRAQACFINIFTLSIYGNFLCSNIKNKKQQQEEIILQVR